jgi:hypothetical protein
VEEFAHKTSEGVNAVAGAHAVKTHTEVISISMIQESAKCFPISIVSAIVLVMLISLVSCGQKKQIMDASRDYVMLNHENSTVESMTIGEGDSTNAYVTVKFLDADGRNRVVVLLLAKNETWRVLKPVEEHRYK